MAMLNLNSASSGGPDVEITLGGDMVVESRITRLESDQKVPDEVALAGPLAVERFLDFKRRNGLSLSPVMEHIEVATCDAAA